MGVVTLRERGLALWRTPLGKVLAVALLLRLTGFTWGLPAADGWDDDGVAPRDFLLGVLETYWPGHHYTYPPLHLIVLALLSLPVWLTALVRATSLSPAAVIHAFINVPTMTAMAVIARAVAVLFSLALIWNVAKIGALLRGSSRTATWVAIAVGLNAVVTYYSQSTNLDLPYLFWSVVSLRWLVDAMVRRQPSSLRRVLVFAALAVATKDQAYALFLLGIPLALAAWLLLDGEARALAPRLAKELAIGAGIAVPILLTIDGALTNPSGWRERMQYLLGYASQDFAYYPRTWAGRLDAAWRGMLLFDQFYPWGFAVLAAFGVAVAWRAPDRAKRAAGLVPLFAAISFTVAFNMSALRSEHRFVLPQMLFFGIYAGLALDEAHARLWENRRGLLIALVAPCLAYALFKCVAVDVAMVLDPRYDAERWIQSHVGTSDLLEIYGSNAQLPRLPANGTIERVDVSPVEGRNPILGVKEIQAPFSDIEARNPRFILVPEFWSSRYLIDAASVAPQGRVLSAGQQRLESDLDSRAYFHALVDGRLPYRLAHVSQWESTFWPQVDIHASLTRTIWLFERD
jgi:hypothetical protein